MNSLPDRRTGATVTTHDRPDDWPRDDPWWNDLDARVHDFGPDEDGGWRNPPY
jgi:hypothetical protein